MACNHSTSIHGSVHISVSGMPPTVKSGSGWRKTPHSPYRLKRMELLETSFLYSNNLFQFNEGSLVVFGVVGQAKHFTKQAGASRIARLGRKPGSDPVLQVCRL